MTSVLTEDDEEGIGGGGDSDSEYLLITLLLLVASIHSAEAETLVSIPLRNVFVSQIGELMGG